MPLPYVHCDVFAPTPYSGNSLAVFIDPPDLTDAQMLTITQELRHFETIFVWPDGTGRGFSARIFDLVEELPFAGHPVLGAACVMRGHAGRAAVGTWQVRLLGDRTVDVDVEELESGWFASIDQGPPEFGAVLTEAQIVQFATAFGLHRSDIAPFAPQVISTGLRYLVIPVATGLSRARITVTDLEARLDAIKADFVYLFDPKTFEGRHWNNDGVTEDIATGSAAGPVGCFAVAHGLAKAGDIVALRQGHFIGRPSRMDVTVTGASSDIQRVYVAGPVSIVGHGTLDVLPPSDA